jgi:hypothetical protein
MPNISALWHSREIRAAKLRAIREQLISGCFGIRPIWVVTGINVKDFSHASFSPDVITLPHPLRSTQVQPIAENILRGTKEGERNPTTLKTMALLEFQLRAGEE